MVGEKQFSDERGRGSNILIFKFNAVKQQFLVYSMLPGLATDTETPQTPFGHSASCVRHVSTFRALFFYLRVQQNLRYVIQP